MNSSSPLLRLSCVFPLLSLVACGGGGGGEGGASTTTIDVSDSFVDARTHGATVCLDINRNLACDAGEVSTVVDETGARLTTNSSTDLDQAFLVAEFPADSQYGELSFKHGVGARGFVLAAPAGDATPISALSTLGVARMLVHDGVAVALPESAEGALLSAWRHGFAAYETTAVGGEGNAEAVSAVAQALLATALKYVDPSTQALFPTVTARTLISETLAAIAPATCSIDALPMLDIETNGHAPIVSKDDYVDANMTLGSSGTDGVGFAAATEIRGRGNSTWGMPKKPYRLKIKKGEEASLLGMPADRDWALLANYADKTMLRNAVAFCMGNMLHMDYTPSHRFVELTLNDAYQGIYQLTEHIKVADHRVSIGDEDEELVDANAGFLLERDSRYEQETHWFISQRGQPYVVKSDVSTDQVNLIRDHVNAMESTLFDESLAEPLVEAANHLDMEALVDFYLINEFMRNNDAFYSSTYVHRAPGGRLVFGPLWDFDIAAGNINYNGNEATEGWWVRNQSVYIGKLLNQPAFEAHVAARWAHLRARLPQLQQFIDQSAATLDEAQTRNFQKWDILGIYVWPNAVVTGSYAGEIAYLKNWLDERATWLDGEFVATP